jgi:hypothetical protein
MLSLMNYETLTIPAGGSLTNPTANGPMNLNDQQIVRIWAPNAWTAAVLTFQGSPNGVNWDDLVDQAGAVVSLPLVGATDGFERAFFVPREWTLGAKFIRFRSGTSALPVNQVAARLIAFSYRPFA